MCDHKPHIFPTPWYIGVWKKPHSWWNLLAYHEANVLHPIFQTISWYLASIQSFCFYVSFWILLLFSHMILGNFLYFNPMGKHWSSNRYFLRDKTCSFLPLHIFSNAWQALFPAIKLHQPIYLFVCKVSFLNHHVSFSHWEGPMCFLQSRLRHNVSFKLTCLLTIHYLFHYLHEMFKGLEECIFQLMSHDAQLNSSPHTRTHIYKICLCIYAYVKYI